MAKDQDFEKDFVRLKNVSKIYRMGEVEIRAVDKIEFAIDKGEFVVVVGPSGAGKTTVLNILGGMDTVTSGDVLVDGENIAKYSQRKLTGYRRDDIGFVFQFYNLVPNLTAKENVELALQICKEPLDAVQVLKEVGLETVSTISRHSCPVVSSREFPLQGHLQKIQSFCSAMSRPEHWIIRPAKRSSSFCRIPAGRKK